MWVWIGDPDSAFLDLAAALAVGETKIECRMVIQPPPPFFVFPSLYSTPLQYPFFWVKLLKLLGAPCPYKRTCKVAYKVARKMTTTKGRRLSSGTLTGLS